MRGLGQASRHHDCKAQAPQQRCTARAGGILQFNNSNRGRCGVHSGVTYAGVISVYEGRGGPGLLGAYIGDPPPSSPSQARPFSRSMHEQITANSSPIKMRENSVATVVPRRPVPYTPTFHFADPIAGPLLGRVQGEGTINNPSNGINPPWRWRVWNYQ